MIINSLSTEYVQARVSAKDSGVDVDVSTLPVSMAITPLDQGTPTDADFHTAEWDTDGTIHRARILVGTAPLDLAPGVYKVWVKVTDNPEAPVKLSGPITIA